MFNVKAFEDDDAAAGFRGQVNGNPIQVAAWFTTNPESWTGAGPRGLFVSIDYAGASRMYWMPVDGVPPSDFLAGHLIEAMHAGRIAALAAEAVAEIDAETADRIEADLIAA